MNYEIDENGYYGEFGGAFVPEMLYKNIQELKHAFRQIKNDIQFKQSLNVLLRDYVGRPSPLFLAQRLSETYNTNIYLKREDLNHTGSHKINNTIGQVLLAEQMGKKRIIAETGAGQHGVATATVCALMDIECIVYMGAKDVERQQTNVEKMRLLGAEVRPVESGSRTLKDATNEAIRDWLTYPEETYYIIGSVVGPDPYPDIVAFFQKIISEEISSQLKQQTGNENPTAVIACLGGGSNAIGAFHNFLDQPSVRLYAIEGAGEGINSGKTAATMALGSTGVIHGSKTLLMQNEDGQLTEPHSISAGLDYPGVGPVHAHLFSTGRVKYLHATDQEALEAGNLLMKLEGIIPALESAHAFAALRQLQFKSSDVVVINLSGRGEKDLVTYINSKS
jgi:tryptophan synthase beta chain